MLACLYGTISLAAWWPRRGRRITGSAACSGEPLHYRKKYLSLLWEDLSFHRGLVRKGGYGAGGRMRLGGFRFPLGGSLFCTAGAVFSSFQVDFDIPKFKMHFDKVHFDMGDVKGHLPWGPLGLPWAPPGPALGFPWVPLGLPEPPLGLSWPSSGRPLALLGPPWALLGPPLGSLWTFWAPLGLPLVRLCSKCAPLSNESSVFEKSRS